MNQTAQQPNVTTDLDPRDAGYEEEFDLFYERVGPDKLRKVWPLLQEGIERIRQSNEDTETWIAADVFNRLMNEQASMYLLVRQDKVIGFMALEVMQFSLGTENKLNIWLAWSKERGTSPAMQRIAHRIARVLDVTGVVFCTPQTNSWVERFKPLVTWYEVPDG